MKCAVAFVLALLVVAEAAKIIPIVSISDIRDESGQFKLSYESGDGTKVSEQGVLKPNADGTDQVLVKQGSYQYTSPDGTPVSLTYTADETGFHPQGAHLPVAPSA